MSHFLRLLLPPLAVALVTALFIGVFPRVNSSTAGFAYLLIVLLFAALRSLPEALAAALLATAALNYFFLPPVGTFTIADPQNWIALTAFLITAFLASRLAARARRQAESAQRQRQDAQRLYELARGLLLASPESIGLEIERRLMDTFAYSEVRLREDESPAPGHARQLSLRLGGLARARLELEGHPVSDETEQAIAGICAIALERARAQHLATHAQALRESEQLKSALLDAVTHDLRTPLTSIRAAAAALRYATGLPATERTEMIEIIETESDRLNRLLEDLVQMASIQGGLGLEPQAVEIEALLESAIALVNFDGSRLKIRLPSPLPRIWVDERLASRALAQLLDNALVYSPPESWVELWAEAEPESVVLRLRNQSADLPPAMRPRLFERFFRGEPARQIRPRGLGLGLAIARGIVLAHGGAIWAEAAEKLPPDTVEFALRLPLSPPGGRAAK